MNSKEELQIIRAIPKENSKTRRRTQGKNLITQEENLREVSQRVVLKTRTLGREERRNPEKCEPHEAKLGSVSVCNNEGERLLL